VGNNAAQNQSIESICEEKRRIFIRYFYRGATELGLDSTEDFVSKTAMEYCGCCERVVLFGLFEPNRSLDKDIL